MFSVQISDHDTFVEKAKSTGNPVTVVRTPTLVPVQHGNAVVMQPALAIDYALEFDDPFTGDTRWSLRVVVLASKDGDVTLTDSLLLKLQAEPSIAVRLAYRSGSL